MKQLFRFYSVGDRQRTAAMALRRLGTGAALLLVAAGTWAGPPRAHTAPASSAWTANPALVAQLGPEVKISVPGMGTYGVRPPRGFTPQQINMMAIAGGALIYRWTSLPKPDNIKADFSVVIGKDNSGMMPGMTSASFLRLEISSVTHTHQNAQISATQQGTIRGLPFARASWQGVGPRTGKKFDGIFYGEFARPVTILINAKDEYPASKTSLPLFNAAALTLHKI